MHYDVCIITGMSKDLGSGHFQRMAALSWRLKNKYNLRVCMKVIPCEGDIPHEFKGDIVRDVPHAKLILRDMRDSSVEEMCALKKKGIVCAIDDRGKGRLFADVRIDVLPHFEALDDGCIGNFLYGYNFIKNLEAIRDEIIVKNIDVVIYAGFDGRSTNFLKSLLPYNASYCVLAGNSKYVEVPSDYLQNGAVNHAKVLCGSKVALSHFGIFLYEAFLTKCYVDAVNPSEYHVRLAEVAKKQLNLTNFGVIDSIDASQVQFVISKQIQNPLAEKVSVKEVLGSVLKSIDAFAKQILQML